MAISRQASFDDLGTPLFDVTFCVLDLETTGASPSDCSITEIGAVKVRGGEVIGTFQTLVDPGRPIPPFITILTGITHAMVIQAPPIDEVLPAFLEFIGSSVIVGHNVAFDLRFLQADARRLGYPRLSNRVADTCALARRMVRSEVRNLRLATLAAHFRSPVTPTHRALDDATATVHVFHALLERAGSLGVTALEDLLVLPTARGSADYRKIHLARELPRSPGVYVFRDRNGTVIYVGKAKNLRPRVSSYFHGDDRRSTTDILRRLEAVEPIVCAGELEASITELRLIHAHRPQFNRAGRPAKSDHFVTLTNEVFPRFSLTRKLHPDALVTLGPFRSKEGADLVLNALWDATAIRRCSGRPGARSGRCVPAQIGVAACPCDGSLNPDQYRRIVDETIAALTADPASLSVRLVERIRTLASEQRFEEAAWVRDRHQALAKAIERRSRWQTLCRSGRVEVVAPDGESALIDRGRLVGSWSAHQPRPLLPLSWTEGPDSEVPPTVAVAAEVDLLWKWLSRPGTAVVGGAINPPTAGMPRLERLAG
jgi:DNA polymerase-3 subunit epsilon